MVHSGRMGIHGDAGSGGRLYRRQAVVPGGRAVVFIGRRRGGGDSSVSNGILYGARGTGRRYQ